MNAFELVVGLLMTAAGLFMLIGAALRRPKYMALPRVQLWIRWLSEPGMRIMHCTIGSLMIGGGVLLIYLGFKG